MKRLMIFVLMTGAAALAFAQNPRAVIREVSGTVEIKRPGDGDWVPAGVGDVIEEAGMISTGFRSTATLSAGSAVLHVRALTRMGIESLLGRDDTETINISLSSGRVRADVNPPAGSRAEFSVRSPSTTASVRGTSFEMDSVSIRVLEGAVSYEPSAASARAVTVSAGQESWVDADTGKAVPPMAAAEASRALPSLPGTHEGYSRGGARLEAPMGTMEMTVTLSGEK